VVLVGRAALGAEPSGRGARYTHLLPSMRSTDEHTLVVVPPPPPPSFSLRAHGLSGVDNQTLFTDFITPECVLEFHRNIVANRLATNGSSWMTVFGSYNSGTCT
jgi:hypothetical protein